MSLIKQVNEMTRTSVDRDMDSDTFNRLVQFAKEDIAKAGAVSDVAMLDVIHGMLENVPGYEDTDAANELAGRVLQAVKSS